MKEWSYMKINLKFELSIENYLLATPRIRKAQCLKNFIILARHGCLFGPSGPIYSETIHFRHAPRSFGEFVSSRPFDITITHVSSSKKTPIGCWGGGGGGYFLKYKK